MSMNEIRRSAKAPPEVAPEINVEKEGVVGETMGFPTVLKETVGFLYSVRIRGTILMVCSSCANNL